MALTNAEKVRAYREREKAKREEERKQAEASHWYVKGDFQTFLDNHPDWDEFELPLDLMGLAAPTFKDGEPVTATGLLMDAEDPTQAAFFKSMGRADVFVGLFIESAVSLARRVNEFKLKEIAERVQELEADLDDPTTRKQALKDIVRLNRMRDQLLKDIRITFPQWKVTGE
jgi:phosphoenolpyruvate synthase/pyruvate phosphate dikinase